MNSEFLVPIAFFALVYGIFHLYVRRKERLALIEKGTDASIFYSNKRSDPSLKYGLLLIGVAVGMIIGNAFAMSSLFADEEVAYFSMVFLFGGLSLVIYYFINRRNLAQEQEKKEPMA